jgi:hypothetical protein
VSPAGGAPTVIDHEYGAVPPVAPNVTGEYDTPTVPLGSVGAVLIVGPGTMLIEKDCVSDPPALSATFTVKLGDPKAAAVGVPLITPPELSDSPAGSDDPLVGDHVNPVFVPPEALSVCE